MHVSQRLYVLTVEMLCSQRNWTHVPIFNYSTPEPNNCYLRALLKAQPNVYVKIC